MRASVRENGFDYSLLRTIVAAVCWRILVIGLACLATSLLYVNDKVSSPLYAKAHNLDGWLNLSPPVVCFGIALICSVVAILPIEAGIARGTLYGVVVGSGLFAAYMSWMVFSSSAVAALRQGIVYWFDVEIPSFWLGLPLILFGGLVGAKCGGAPIPIAILPVVGLVLFAMPLWQFTFFFAIRAFS